MGAQVRTMRLKRIVALVGALIASLWVRASWGQDAGVRFKEAAKEFARDQIENTLRSMNRPFEPFHLIGNIYYVGASDVTSFLITTPEGHIVINSGFADTVPMIRDNVRTLGFRFEDIKLLLNSHAHLDHAGGHALLKKLTGARVVMSEADADLLARGGRGDFLPVKEDVVDYEPAKADQIIADEEPITLGGAILTAHLTPGHTKGCTTWTMDVVEDGKTYHVVIYGSTTIFPGVRLVDNPRYPGMAQDFAKTFRVLKSLPCDVFLGPHGSQFGLADKARRLKAGEKPNPFIDPEGYQAYLAQSAKNFQRQWDRERRRGISAEVIRSVIGRGPGRTEEKEGIDGNDRHRRRPAHRTEQVRGPGSPLRGGRKGVRRRATRVGPGRDYGPRRLVLGDRPAPLCDALAGPARRLRPISFHRCRHRL